MKAFCSGVVTEGHFRALKAFAAYPRYLRGRFSERAGCEAVHQQSVNAKSNGLTAAEISAAGCCVNAPRSAYELRLDCGATCRMVAPNGPLWERPLMQHRVQCSIKKATHLRFPVHSSSINILQANNNKFNTAPGNSTIRQLGILTTQFVTFVLQTNPSSNTS